MATPIFCCGAECGVTGIGTHMSVSGATISTAVVRSGARAFEIVAGNNVQSNTAGFCVSNTFAVVRFYLRFSTLPTATGFIVGVSNSGDVGIKFQHTDNTLRANSDTVLGSTGAVVTAGVWYLIDLKVDRTTNSGTGATVNLSVDGAAVAQAVDTSVSIGLTPDILWVCPASGVCYVDDVIISATAADYPIGAGYVNHFVPTADGTHNIAGAGDFQRGNTAVDILNATTTAWQLVDDVPLPSGAVTEADCWRAVAPATPSTDYVEAVFGPAAGISTPTAGPRAVDVILVHHQIASQNGQMQVLLNDNGTTDTTFDTGVAAGVTTYRYARKHYADPPSAASAWTVVSGNGNFNDVRVRFRGPDAAPDQCLDAIMIEAEFSEVAAAGHPAMRRLGRTPRGVSGVRIY